jgi:hypothetical protein
MCCPKYRGVVMPVLFAVYQFDQLLVFITLFNWSYLHSLLVEFYVNSLQESQLRTTFASWWETSLRTHLSWWNSRKAARCTQVPFSMLLPQKWNWLFVLFTRKCSEEVSWSSTFPSNRHSALYFRATASGDSGVKLSSPRKLMRGARSSVSFPIQFTLYGRGRPKPTFLTFSVTACKSRLWSRRLPVFMESESTES